MNDNIVQTPYKGPVKKEIESKTCYRSRNHHKLVAEIQRTYRKDSTIEPGNECYDDKNFHYKR